MPAKGRRFASGGTSPHTVGLQWILFLGGALLLASFLPFGGFWGFWIAVILMSAVTAHFSARLLERRRTRRQISELGRVDTAHNQGKLGTLLLQRGSVRSAIQALERAVAGEPGVAEWRYRLGAALRASGEHARAAKELAAALAIAPAHAYGDVAVELALARQAQGDDAGALQALDHGEREHGETVRTSFLRGKSLARLGRKEEARAAFLQVSEIARRLPEFSRRGTLRWRAQAWLARLR